MSEAREAAGSEEPSTHPDDGAEPRPNVATWRRRVARALLVGGVLYGALSLAPALPHAQTLDFRAPDGEHIVEIEVTVRDSSGVAQNAAKLHPREPQSQLRHAAELADGAYHLELSAVLERPGAPQEPKARRTVALERQVRLEEHTVRVDLTP